MRELIEVPGTTLEIYMYEEAGIIYYEFDSRLSEPPEPMINALRLLQRVDAANKRLVMINRQEPIGLYDRIQDVFEWHVTPSEEDDVKVEFFRKV